MLLVILGKNYVSGDIISYISCIYVKIKLKIDGQKWGDQKMCFLNYAYSINYANEQLYNTTMISN